MIRHIIYGVLGTGSLGLLLFAAPTGMLLTGTPERGKVERDASGNVTARGRGPAFIWLGGGYQGGK
jgi:hypothetical protein